MRITKRYNWNCTGKMGFRPLRLEFVILNLQLEVKFRHILAWELGYGHIKVWHRENVSWEMGLSASFQDPLEQSVHFVMTRFSLQVFLVHSIKLMNNDNNESLFNHKIKHTYLIVCEKLKKNLI